MFVPRQRAESLPLGNPVCTAIARHRRARRPAAWLLAVLAFVVTLELAPAPRAVQAQSDEQTRALALDREASERIEELRRESATLSAQADSLLAQVQRLEVERELRTEELAQLDRQLARTTQVLEETGQQIADLQATLDAQRPKLRARLVETYKMGQARYARLLLSVNDLRSLGRTYRMVTELAHLDRRRVEEYNATLGALGSTMAALEAQQIENRQLRARARAARRDLDESIAAQSELLARIGEQRDLNGQFTAELERSRQLLQAMLAAMASDAPSGPVPPALPLRPFRGALAWPVTGIVTEATNTPGPEAGTVIVRDGIEIAARQGLAVRAIHQGQVAYADAFTGFGNMVIVDHGNETYSVYGYLSVIAARPGALVDRGQILGSIGRSPTGTPALYFELRIDGTAADPLEWLEESRP